MFVELPQLQSITFAFLVEKSPALNMYLPQPQVFYTNTKYLGSSPSLAQPWALSGKIPMDDVENNKKAVLHTYSRDLSTRLKSLAIIWLTDGGRNVDTIPRSSTFL